VRPVDGFAAHMRPKNTAAVVKFTKYRKPFQATRRMPILWRMCSVTNGTDAAGGVPAALATPLPALANVTVEEEAPEGPPAGWMGFTDRFFDIRLEDPLGPSTFVLRATAVAKMSRVSPQDESEEGEIRPEQYRYSVGDRSDRDRDRRDAGIVHNPSFPNRRGPSVSDSRAPRDPSLDTDRIRKDLQAALSRPDGTLDSAVLAELLRSSNRKDTLERLLDRDREHGSSRSAGSRDHGSPEFRRDDRQYLRGRDNERDRHSVRDYPRDRPPSVGGGTSELAPPNREVWYGNRNRLHEGPGNREGSHHWQRGERPAIRTTPPSFSRPSMLATQQQPTVHAQGRPRSGSDVESTDEWRRQQRSNILNAGPEALRTTSSGSARAHVSRWSDGPVEDTGAQVRPAPAPGLLRSPPPMPAAQDSAPEVSTGQTTAGRQKDPTNGDVDEMYDISDGEGGEEIEETAEPVGASQPTELEPSAADASLELDLETLSLDKVVSVLEEMERSERSLQEQLRGMHHEFEVWWPLAGFCVSSCPHVLVFGRDCPG
jgi:hypothetical protein